MVGKFKTARGGMTHLLVAVDKYTKWVEMEPIKKLDGKTATKFLQKLIGLEAKMKQYEQGEKFIAAVERVGGPELLAQAWEDPANLPSIAEIREPAAWIDRVGGNRPALAAG